MDIARSYSAGFHAKQALRQRSKVWLLENDGILQDDLAAQLVQLQQTSRDGNLSVDLSFTMTEPAFLNVDEMGVLDTHETNYSILEEGPHQCTVGIESSLTIVGLDAQGLRVPLVEPQAAHSSTVVAASSAASATATARFPMPG